MTPQESRVRSYDYSLKRKIIGAREQMRDSKNLVDFLTASVIEENYIRAQETFYRLYPELRE